MLVNARELGVRGTVRNRADGAVEALFQADDPAAIAALVDQVREGPWPARVDAVDVEPAPEADRHEEMRVVP